MAIIDYKGELVKAGIYRHYKGPLYQTLGVAHDANADTFFGVAEPCKDLEGFDAILSPMLFEHGRNVVVYIALQLDGAHLGPRLAVRTLEDFLCKVCTNTEHGHYGKPPPKPDILCGFEQRFTYLGPELTAEMLP